jgi:hypothetical protein
MTIPSACDLCGGVVEMKTGEAHMFGHWANGSLCFLPENVSVATCTECGETYMTVEELQQLTERRKSE